MLNAYYLYKVAHFFSKYKIPLIPKIIQLFIFLIYNSSIPYQCIIGKNTRFAYGGIGVIIHKKATIGEDVIIGSSVVIGGKKGHTKLPVIGNNVYISTGSKIIGNVKVGNNVTIGANAVVINDIPDNSVVAGVPAKIIKTI